MTGGTFGSPNPNAPPAFRQFAFLIGEWRFNASARDGEGREFAFLGEWIGRYILDGNVIADEFRMRGPDGALVMLGMNFRQFDARAKRWIMKWLDTTAARWMDLGPEELGGTEVDESRIRFKTEFAPGELHRITFHNIQPNRFAWQADRSTDGGETWDDGIMTIDAIRTAGP